MRNRDYWRIRAEQDQIKLLKPFEDLVEKQIKLYEDTLLGIQKDIDYYVKRFANNNGIFNLYEASKLLKGDDLKEFKMTLQEYIRLNKDTVLSKKFEKELENASLKVRVTRLQALELEIIKRIEFMYSQIDIRLTEELRTLIEENQSRIAYNISTQYQNLVHFTKIDDNLIDQLLKTPWTVDELNFSERLWRDKVKLINVINIDLKNAIIRGKANSNNTFKMIQDKLNANRKVVKRLVVTESAYFSERAKQETYNQLDLEKYEVVGTLDSRTCSICGGHDGEIWDTDKYEVGVTAPVYHPNCRCTTAPYIEDLDDGDGDRFARDKDGNGIYVPSNMTYEEYKKKYLNGNA